MAKRLTVKNLPQETKLFVRRTLIIGCYLLSFAVLIFCRLFYLQIDQHEHYKLLSTQNQIQQIPINPNRGLIYDRNGILLADNLPVFSLELTPDRIKDVRGTIKELQKIIPITQDEIDLFYRQVRQHRPFEPVPLRIKLSETERARIAVQQYKFPGVDVKARLIRHYLFNTSLVHILGYVGRINEEESKQVDPIQYSATNFIGKLGVEKFYENLLHGKVGYERAEVDASGRILRVVHRTPPTPGNNLYLTLDSKLQSEIEKILGPLRGAVVVLNPQNGEVLALVSAPSYDPNLFVEGISGKDYRALRNSPDQPLYNRALRGQYPFASTVKPFLALEGLDSGTVSTSFAVRDPGWFRLPNSSHIYRDWKKGGHGALINIHRAVVVSCDIYFYTLANMMGINHIHSILTRFGFGSKTGLDVGEELPGLIPNPRWKLAAKKEAWYPGDTINAGIGQGYMLVTPVQLASGVATLGMRGLRMRPHFLMKQETPTKDITISKPEKLFPVVLKNTYVWTHIIEAMQAVIREAGGTGYKFGRDAPYSLAGKTGTGQVFSAKFHSLKEKNLPEKLRDHSYFIAFAPADKPKVAIAVVIENSKLASKVARAVLDYYLLNKQPGNIFIDAHDDHHASD